MPLTEPTVPTGMKIGVSICPWSVVMMPHLASDPGSVAVFSNFISFFLNVAYANDFI